MSRKRSAGGKRGMAAALVAVAAMLSAVLAFGYNPFQDNLGTVSAPDPVIAAWDSMPVTWLLNPDTPAGNVNVSGCLSGTPGGCIQQSLTNGFNTWMGAQVAGQSLTTLNVHEPPGTSTLTDPVYDDCQNVVGFSDTTSGDFSTGTIAFTQVSTVTRPSGTTGTFQYTCQSSGATKTCDLDDCMADADIEFNPTVQFYTNTPPSGTTATCDQTQNPAFSLQSVATHEEGHLLGLDHSGIAHAVMFPFGDTCSGSQQITLSTDDAVGISFLYPASNYLTSTGAISGTVNLSGSGVFGAHVIAVNANTGNAVIDSITASDGSYILDGVPPGSYYVLALPFSPNADSGVLTIDDFSGWLCGYGDSQCTTVLANPTSYTGRYH